MCDYRKSKGFSGSTRKRVSLLLVTPGCLELWKYLDTLKRKLVWDLNLKRGNRSQKIEEEKTNSNNTKLNLNPEPSPSRSHRYSWPLSSLTLANAFCISWFALKKPKELSFSPLHLLLLLPRTTPTLTSQLFSSLNTSFPFVRSLLKYLLREAPSDTLPKKCFLPPPYPHPTFIFLTFLISAITFCLFHGVMNCHGQ